MSYLTPLETNTPLNSLGRYMLLSLLAILLGAICVYIVYQARFLLLGPQITLFEPSETTVVTTEKYLEISGNAKNIVTITINDRTIFTDDTGNFTERVFLQPGINSTSLRAQDRYRRTTTTELQIIKTEQSTRMELSDTI